MKIGKKIADVVGIPIEKAEAYQIIYYDKTQEYYNHYDGWLLDGSEKSIRCMKYGGQRLRTALCYLNTVPEGGETRFTRLNVDVKAELGKLLVFSNVQRDTNIRHPLAEHAGKPVIEGEKWAFNLWFREASRSTIVYDPKPLVQQNTSGSVKTEASPVVDIFDISKTSVDIKNTGLKETAIQSNTESKKQQKVGYTEIPDRPFIRVLDNAIPESIISQIFKNVKFETDAKRTISWLKNEDYPVIIELITKVFQIDKDFLESMCVVRYPPGLVHNRHFDAFDDERVTKESRGQRIMTVTGFLDNNFIYSFPESKINNFQKLTCSKGNIIAYNNTFPETLIRDKRLSKMIKNTNEEFCSHLFHIFLREKPRRTPASSSTANAMNTRSEIEKKLREFENSANSANSVNTSAKVKEEPIQITELEDFKNTLNETYDLAKNKILTRKGHKSLSFSNIKTPWDDVMGTIDLLSQERFNDTILNEELLQKVYEFDEFTPCIVNNCLKDASLKIIQDYTSRNIKKKSYPLGDRQSNRFKTIDDPINRMLHFEMLPLIERITGKRLKPSYTYLSCYLNEEGKDTRLPQHTDRAECYFTVSFIIDKPQNSKWPIYFHKVKQPVKNKGRYEGEPPSKDECIPCDCDAGGLMIFMGEDHKHFREQINCDFYNIVLLHYVLYP